MILEHVNDAIKRYFRKWTRIFVHGARNLFLSFSASSPFGDCQGSGVESCRWSCRNPIHGEPVQRIV